MLSELIDKYIAQIVAEPIPVDNPFRDLMSLGELIDRLAIVNIKLYNLKNEVMKNTDTEFRAKASVLDVALVEERAKLKRCIDLKVISMIGKPQYTQEVKSYGKDFND